MSDLNEVLGRIDGYRDQVIQLQEALTSRVALGPENGGTGEHEKTEFLRELLRGMHPDTMEEVRAPDGRAREGYRPNLLARWSGVEKGSTVWVLSHSDVVPPGDFSLWESDPFRVRVLGDKVIGRGVEDNQHGIVSSILALQAILGAGLRPHRNVGLAIVADEETGSALGLDYVLQKRRDLFGKDDLIIVPDGGNEEGTMIEVAEKSMLWVKFTVTGRQCHASTPHRGNNSLLGAARLILDLADLRTRFADTDELFSPKVSTFEPTKIENNVPNVNTIPGRDVFYLDCRVLPRYRVDEVLAACSSIAAGVASELNLDIRTEAFHRQDATEPTPSDAPVVKALARAIRRITGKEAKPMGIGGGTVAAFFRKAGLPAAVWCTVSDSAHQPNEYCLISNILADAKIFASIYLDEGAP
jgi:succinyl-diaminopimelate desuccinylase